MSRILRISARLLAVLFWTLGCAALQSLLLALPFRWPKERFARFYWRGVRVILGLRITVIGAIDARRPVLFVANHYSWVDIITLGSVLPGCFVAKGEVAGWPVFGTIAKLGRTAYVSRNRTGVKRESGDLLKRLAAGDNLILFPEGTTSDGNRVLKFQSAFLAVAEAAPPPFVQPVTLVYDRMNGLPVRRSDRAQIAWYGDMDLFSHFPGIAGLRSCHATLVLDAAIPPAAFPNRKALSAALEARLAGNAAELRQGRKVAALTAPLAP